MKSFRQFIIEKKRETLPDPFDADYEKKIGEIEKKNINKNQKKGEEVLKDIEKKKPRQNRKTKSNQSSSPEAKAKAQAIKDIQDTGGTDPRFKRSGEGEFSKGGGKFREPVKPEQAKGSKPKPGSVSLGDTTKGGEVRTNKPKSLQGRKELLKRSFNLGNRSDKYKTNVPPSGKQVQQFAKDISGQAADNTSGVGGTKGVGQTKSLKGQTLTGGKYRGATPIDKRSAAELRKFAKDASATENPLSGKTQKSTLKSAAKRVNQKLEDAKKAASKQTKRLNKAQAYTKKINDARIKKEANKIIEKIRRIRKNEKSGLTNRMSNAYDTRQSKLKIKANEILKSINKDSKSSSTFKYKSPPTANPDLGKSKVRQSVKGPGSSTGSLSRANLRFSGDANYQQLKKTIDPVKPKTVNPRKTYNQFQKDISRIRGTQSTFPKSNLSYKIKKWTTKIPKVGLEPLTAIQGYARQRDVKNATPARAITGGILKGGSFWQGFKQGSKLSTAAALKVTKHPAYVAGAGLVGGLTGGYVTSTGTEYAFDKLLGKTGTKTQTLTDPQKTKNKNKVITANPKNNKGIILPPGGEKKKKITSFALNPAKVSK